MHVVAVGEFLVVVMSALTVVLKPVESALGLGVIDAKLRQLPNKKTGLFLIIEVLDFLIWPVPACKRPRRHPSIECSPGCRKRRYYRPRARYHQRPCSGGDGKSAAP